jgi:hypothetical protein
MPEVEEVAIRNSADGNGRRILGSVIQEVGGGKGTHEKDRMKNSWRCSAPRSRKRYWRDTNPVTLKDWKHHVVVRAIHRQERRRQIRGSGLN